MDTLGKPKVLELVYNLNPRSLCAFASEHPTTLIDRINKTPQMSPLLLGSRHSQTPFAKLSNGCTISERPSRSLLHSFAASTALCLAAKRHEISARLATSKLGLSHALQAQTLSMDTLKAFVTSGRATKGVLETDSSGSSRRKPCKRVINVR